jgi:phage FluMu gp28-like protein
MLIDQNGIGNQLAEQLSRRYPGKAEGVLFTNASKGLWATDAKMLVQQRKTPIHVGRDLAYQIHSIKKLVTASKNLVFDTDTNEKHHADKFWAWALALAAAKSGLATVQRSTLPKSLADYTGLNA